MLFQIDLPMIVTKQLSTLKDFEALRPGDTIACEFHRDVYDGHKNLLDLKYLR